MEMTFSAIYNPEFIDLSPLDLSPLISSCSIKVMYLGKNRNGSFFNKEVATEMAKTLRGNPIVGWFREDKGDFRDHGHSVVFEDGEMKEKTNTVPYGFVAPDARIWFQKFQEFDEFGNPVEREYLMTTGYLWTGQFPECKCVVDEGRPQSMELDEESLNGKWAEDTKSGMEFFIINDATFSKLCILGKDVEPCFEGANVTSYSYEGKFTSTLFTMMQELKDVLKGGNEMELDNVEVTPVAEEEKVLENVDNSGELEATETEVITETEENTSVEAEPAEEATPEEAPVAETFAKKDDEKEEDKDEKAESKSGEEDSKEDTSDEDEDKKKKYELLEHQYTELQKEFEALKAEKEELVAFKKSVEDAKKDEMIASFTMLSDEDKADVVAHKSEYSLDEIEAKLCVIGKHKGVNFSVEAEETPAEPVITQFALDGSSAAEPAWVKAARLIKESNL